MDKAQFRPMNAGNIDRLSSLFETYSGSPLHKEGILRSTEIQPCWSIWQDEEPLGFYHTLRFAPDILKLVNIFVRHDARRKGLGSTMLAQLLEVIPEPIAGVIAVNTALFKTVEEKLDPHSFYLRNGFELIARTGSSKVFWKDRGSADS